MSLKQQVKRSQLMVALVRAGRALAMDANVLRWSMVRGAVIRRYMAGAGPKKLHLGASNSVLAGWLNTDVIPVQPGVIYLDATRPFPFKDNSFDYVYSEHMIEHIDHDSGDFMLGECHRILKPGGTIRMATPDLSIIVGLLAKDKTPMQERYIQWIVGRCLPGVTYCRDAFVVNNAFRAWGHAFLYNQATLSATISSRGFGKLIFYKPGQSDDPVLKDLETHGKEVDAEDINQFETMVVEAKCLKKDK